MYWYNYFHKISSDITWLQFAQIYLASAMAVKYSLFWLHILTFNNSRFRLGVISHEN
jgi:hypothetical protein